MRKEIVFATEWFSIEAQHRKDGVRALKGKPFYKVLLPDGVVILPVTPDNRFVLIRQYRPSLDQRTFEFPAGAVGRAEKAVDAAVRELYEETGYRCEEMKLVGRGVLRIDREDSQNSFFLARNARRDPAFEPKEDIETLLLSPQEFRQLVAEDRFHHIAALPILVMAQWKFGTNFFPTPLRGGDPS